MPLSLRQLRKLFKKSSQKSSDGDLTVPSPIISEVGVSHAVVVPPPPEGDSPVEQASSHCALPVELWAQIVSLVDSKQDQLSLCRTSRTLQLLSEPYIYRSIYQSGNELFPTETFEKLAQAIQNPRRASLITSINIWFNQCKKRNGAYPDHSHEECTCNRRDDILGQVLVPLSNLERLSITCYLCKSDIRHSYLQKLTTRKLTEMQLDCRGYTAACTIPFQIFVSPCMQTVTYLKWMEYNNEPLSDLQLAFVESNNYLPRVTKISASYLRAFVPLLRKGAISSITCDRSNSGLAGILIKCPPAISDLHSYRLDFMIPDIVRNPAPYRRLQSISGIRIEVIDPDEIIPKMAGLRCLPSLNTIVLHLQYYTSLEYDPNHSYNDLDSPELVCNLSQELRSLRQVSIRTSWYPLPKPGYKSRYRVWNFDGEWRGRG